MDNEGREKDGEREGEGQGRGGQGMGGQGRRGKEIILLSDMLGEDEGGNRQGGTVNVLPRPKKIGRLKTRLAFQEDSMGYVFGTYMSFSLLSYYNIISYYIIL